jgi:cytochrome P450
MPQQQLPPGPRMPRVLQMTGWQFRPIAFLEQCRRRYGKRFTVRFHGMPAFVMHATPEAAKEIFTAPPDVLHPGEGARILEPVLGKNSVILLDEGDHLSQRKLMLPSFHGEKMKRLEGLMYEVAEREVDAWPKDRAVELHPRFQALTLEVILRTVFGLDPGSRLDAVREQITREAELATQPLSAVPQLQGHWNPRWRKFVDTRAAVDRHVFDLIADRRAERAKGTDRDDILSLLLDARHDDGSPMSDQELRDELMTLLVAGHETTASQLAWVMERLAREPRVVDNLVAEVDGADGDAYLTATIQETMRRRPVLPNAAPRLVKKPVEIDGWHYEPNGVCVVVNSYLIHHDPDIYPDPYAFRPERFLDEPPGTYTWTPFGGGRRRCLGASFALMEMKVILRALFERSIPVAGRDGVEIPARRAITIAPSQAAPTVLKPRAAAREPAVV